jgi:hypothetical protein
VLAVAHVDDQGIAVVQRYGEHQQQDGADGRAITNGHAHRTQSHQGQQCQLSAGAAAYQPVQRPGCILMAIGCC